MGCPQIQSSCLWLWEWLVTVCGLCVLHHFLDHARINQVSDPFSLDSELACEGQSPILVMPDGQGYQPPLRLWPERLGKAPVFVARASNMADVILRCVSKQTQFWDTGSDLSTVSTAYCRKHLTETNRWRMPGTLCSKRSSGCENHSDQWAIMRLCLRAENWPLLFVQSKLTLVIKVGSSCSITLHDVLIYNVRSANVCPRQFAGSNVVFHTEEQLPHHDHTSELPVTESVFAHPNDSPKPWLYATAFPSDKLTIVHAYRGWEQQWATRPVRAGSDSAPGHRHRHPWPTTNSEQWKSDGERRAAAGWGAEWRLSPMVHGRHHILGQCQCRCLGYSSPANSPSSARCTPPPTDCPPNSARCTPPANQLPPKLARMNSHIRTKATTSTRGHPSSLTAS